MNFPLPNSSDYSQEVYLDVLYHLTEDEGRITYREVSEKVDVSLEELLELRKEFKESDLVDTWTDEQGFTRYRLNKRGQELLEEQGYRDEEKRVEDKESKTEENAEEESLELWEKHGLTPELTESIDSLLEEDGISTEQAIERIEGYLEENY